jgi:hypothetical protein
MDNMEVVREHAKRRSSRGGGWHKFHEKYNLHCTHCGRNGSHEATYYRFLWEKMKDRNNPKEDKVKKK